MLIPLLMASFVPENRHIRPISSDDMESLAALHFRLKSIAAVFADSCHHHRERRLHDDGNCLQIDDFARPRMSGGNISMRCRDTESSGWIAENAKSLTSCKATGRIRQSPKLRDLRGCIFSIDIRYCLIKLVVTSLVHCGDIASFCQPIEFCFIKS